MFADSTSLAFMCQNATVSVPQIKGSALWTSLMALLGAGALIMVVTILVYVVILAITGIGAAKSGNRLEELPVTSFQAAKADGQQAWFGAAAMGVVLAGMYLGTTVAFRLMKSLPLR